MFSFFKKQDVAFIVYQMGKVGSRTIKHSLENIYGNKRVLNTHDHEEAKEYIEKWSQSFDSVIVITGFREPLTRCISAYFQNLTNEKNHWFVGQQENVMEKSIDWLINDYNAKVVPHIHKIIGPWLENYERVINRKLTEFSEAKGCLKSEFNNVHFYIYKLETLTEFYQGMADDRFMNKVRAASSNMSKDKWYAPIYRDFKKRYQISRENYDALYGNLSFVRGLYDEYEIIDLTKSFVMESTPLTNSARKN